MICNRCGGEKVWREFPSRARWFCPECHRRQVARFQRTNKGKATLARYFRTDKGKAAQARHNRTDKGKATRARTKAKYPSRSQARTAIGNAIASGKLRRRPCLVTGEKQVQAHHAWGYEKENWLRVIWLTPAEHRKADRDPEYNAELIRIHDFVESI